MQLPAIAERMDSYPLAPLQHGMLFHYLVEGQHTGCDVQQLDVALRDEIEMTRLKNAWMLAAARHPVLRTRFRWDGLDAPRQEVMSTVELPVVANDLSNLEAEARAAAIDQFLATDRRLGFDLSTAPLWRVTLFRIGNARYRMVWTYSHAILDGCAAEVLREVLAAYRALGDGTIPAFADRPSYGEHIFSLQRDWSGRAPAARAFWRQRLGGFVKPSAFVMHGTEASGSLLGGSGSLRFQPSASADAAVRDVCKARGLGRVAFVQAAWAIVLGAFTGEEDVVFGEVRTCRRESSPGVESVIGLLLNTLPVRANVAGERAVEALVRDLDEHQAAVRAFEHTPLAEVAAASELPRGTRLFGSLVSVADRDGERFRATGAPAGRCVLHERMDAAVTLEATLEPRLTFTLSFDRGRFDSSFARRVATLMKRLIHAMAARPSATVAELPRLPAGDERALEIFNDTSVQVPEPVCLHQLVEAQVDRAPEEVAFICRDESLTYGELDRRANRVAAELVGHGIGPDRTVGIFVDRSLDMVVGLLGILKAGGAYVPLDPAYPAERLAMMLEDARPGVLLTVARLRAALPAATAEVVEIDGLVHNPTPVRVKTPVRPDHLAYVIFTSGSTGRPKGVQVEHRHVVNCFCGMDGVLGTSPGAWLALTGISFDISVLELIWTLTRGFRVVIQDPAERGGAPSDRGAAADPRHRPFYDFDLRSQVRRHQITHLQCTPSLLERFALESGGLEALGGLRHVLVGGEALPAALVDHIAPYLSGTLHNVYGPTETTIWSTAWTVTAGGPVTIGRPIANTTVHIRDRGLRPMPIGAPGELLIGGAGVTRGYVGRPDLTAERFIHDPATGQRLYRTGDLAAWRPDGQIAFLGRLDHQVKILGYRVELEEVDAVLGEHPSVRECVTVAQPGPSGDVRLVAYVVPQMAEGLPPAVSPPPSGDLPTVLRQYAQQRLPGFMVPSAVVTLLAFPMTPNGKADRRALASRRVSRSKAPSLESERERAILAVMRDVVGHDVSVNDNFFDCGADSLGLLQACGRLGAQLGRRVTFAEVLAHPTGRALAEALADADADALTVDQSQQRAEQRQDAMRRRRPGPRPAIR